MEIELVQFAETSDHENNDNNSEAAMRYNMTH